MFMYLHHKDEFGNPVYDTSMSFFWKHTMVNLKGKKISKDLLDNE